MGDVTSYTLHNLQPGTTYDVKVLAQYTGGTSAPLVGQGTTRTYIQSRFLRFMSELCTVFNESLSDLSVYLNVTNIETYNVGHDTFCIKWTPHRAATSYRIKLNPVDRKSARMLVLVYTELSYILRKHGGFLIKQVLPIRSLC